MLYSLPPAAGYRLAGLKTLLLAPWSGAALYSYATAELSTITSFSGLAGWQLFGLEPGSAAEFGEAVARGKSGLLTAQLVSVGTAGLSAATRTAVVALLEGGPVVALCQDYANQWWLLGQTAGLQLLSAAAKGGPLGGDTGWALPLTGTQREPARVVANGRVALLYNSSTVFNLPA